MLHVTVIAVGRLRKGPELELVSDYLDRFAKTGRPLGLGPCDIVEVEDRKGGGMAAEADLIRSRIPKGAIVGILDERGRKLTSPQFAERLGSYRDDGRGELALVIGGADGIDPAFRAEADFALSFGAMVWPHMLVRVMLAEQLYRAASILAGAPYHRV